MRAILATQFAAHFDPPPLHLRAIVTLAFGIGANVVVFGVLNSLILHPLNVAESDQLFSVVQKQHGNDLQSYPDYLDFRSRNNTFSDMVAYKLYGRRSRHQECSEEELVYEVSGNYFRMLGLRPEQGRFFDLNDEHGPNSAPYVVLSDSFWRDRFAGDPHVLGTTVDINKQSVHRHWCCPKGFHGTEVFFWPDFWVPWLTNSRSTDMST